jgi:peptide/nickel transport system substrate-binding protein
VNCKPRLAGVLALLLATACAQHHISAADSHVLRIADEVDPSSLNPLLAHDQDTIGYDLLVTQTLVGLSSENRLVPVLVTRVPSRANGDVSADGRKIVYHLRSGVRFADGVLFSSRDVVFTYQAILDPRNPVLSADAYRRIASLDAPDARTVVIRLRERWNAAVAELFAQADFAFGILPSHAFSTTDVTRADWNAHPFGTGPFRVVSWQRANRIVLEPNPYFRPAPALKRIVFDLIPSAQAALIALRSGVVDVAEMDAAQIPNARGVAGIHLMITPINGEYMLTLQTAAWPTSDLAVRRAIADALDRREIVRGRFGAMTAADSFLPPVFAWHDPSPQSPVANLAAVSRELTAGGWQRGAQWWSKNGQPLSVTIDLEAERGTWMETIEQEQLRRAGIDARLKTFVAAQFNAPDGPLRSGRFTLAQNWWIGAADPEQSVIVACSQQGPNGNNNSNYCSRAFETYFNDQATTSSESRRRSDFITMQRIVRGDAPIVPIAFMSDVDAISDRVQNFRRNMLMYPVDPERWDVR